MKEVLANKAVVSERRLAGSGSAILAASSVGTNAVKVIGSNTARRESDESSRACLRPLGEPEAPRRRPGRTDGITPRFEGMLQEASRAGFEAGYRAAFQALGLDARAVRVLRVVSARELPKVLGAIQANDRVAVLRRLEEMPPGDE